MIRRPSDAWIGAAVLLACFSLLSWLSHVVIAVLVVGHLALMGIGGLVALHLWLKPQHLPQRLACALLTLPVFGKYGIVCAVAVFLTLWNTHVGHDFTVPGKPLPPGVANDA